MNIAIPEQLVIGFCLALARTAGFVHQAPPFSGTWLPMRVKAGLVVAISLSLASRFPTAGIAGDSAALIGAVVTQVVCGLAFGFCIQVVVTAISTAGELIDGHVGFASASMFDPLSGYHSTPFGRIYQLLSTALLFAIGGHILIVRAFLRTVEAAPLAGLDLHQGPQALVSALALMMVAAVELAIPVLAALFLADLAIGLIGKAAPQLQLIMVSFPAKITLALSLTAGTIVLLPAGLDSLLTDALDLAGRVIR